MYPGKWSHREVIRWGGVDLMQPCKVIIFGGTTEGRELARILADRGALGRTLECGRNAGNHTRI